MIHILPRPKLRGLGYQWFSDLHTAILVTEDGVDGDLASAIDRVRDEDPYIVVIALLAQRNDALEQALLHRNCDDVITAPICADTLASRLVLRVRQRGWSIGANDTIQLYDTTVDFKELRVYRSDSVKPLSRGLADLLQFFLNHAGQTVSREHIFNTLWADRAIDSEGKSLDMQVSKLRRLLEPTPKVRKHRLIKSVQGVGYRLDLPSTPIQSRTSPAFEATWTGKPAGLSVAAHHA